MWLCVWCLLLFSPSQSSLIYTGSLEGTGFTCDGSVPQEKVCNFVNDCGDDSDEQDCPSICGFENDACGWQETDSDGYDWTWAQANDPASGTNTTGPFTDATGNTQGHFLLLQEELTTQAGGLGQVFSHWYQNAKAVCEFGFWYYTSRDLGSDLLVRLNSSAVDLTLMIFNEDIITEEVWDYASVGTGRHKDPFQLSLYSAQTPGFSGVFAVDEMRLEECGYPKSEVNCSQGLYHCPISQICISEQDLCDLTDNCGSREDEDEGLCGDYQRSTLEDGELKFFSQGQDGVDDDTDWLLGSGTVVSGVLGPSYDHSLWSPEGHYLYLNVPPQDTRTAKLVSNPLLAGPNCSFTFYYNFYAAVSSNLTVLIRLEDGTTTQVLALHPRPVYSFWERAHLVPEVLPDDQLLQVVIAAVHHHNSHGTIAIDDFVFHPDCSISNETSPSSTPHPENCTAQEFECGASGVCLPISKQCNFVSDCPGDDKSDEKGCVASSCSFEGGDLCGWEIMAINFPDQDDKNQSRGNQAGEARTIHFTWQMTQGSVSVEQPFDQYKPDMDHSTMQEDGYYLYTFSLNDDYESSTDLATKYYFGETAKTCRLGFWFWLSGPASGSLHVMLRPQQGETFEVWMRDGNFGNQWQMGEVWLGELEKMGVSVQARRGVSYEGVAGLDDVTFYDCSPPMPPPNGTTCEDFDKYQCASGGCVSTDAVCDFSDDCLDQSDEMVCGAYMYRCNFESGTLQAWQQDLDDSANWVLLQASADLVGVLPPIDHTLGTDEGHYIFVDSSVAQLNGGVVARLHSPVIRSSVSQCSLRLWYQLTGTNPGVIKLYRRISYYSEGYSLLARLVNTVQDVWLKFSTRVDLSGSEGDDFQVVIEGEVPQDANGFLVVDDLSMTEQCEQSSNQHLPGEDLTTTPQTSCAPGLLQCSNGLCYDPIEACNFIDDCLDGSDEQSCTKACDFETDMCGWFENSASSTHWTLSEFPAPPPGPPSDHNNDMTKQDLSTSTTTSYSGQVAILESHTFTAVGPNCVLDFYYYLGGSGQTSCSLSLFRKSEDDAENGLDPELLWKEISDSQIWKRYYASIGGKRYFSIYFKAVHGSDKTHIALDDITFRNCQATGECHTTNDFQCSDGSCVPRQYRCDAKFDCQDKSDEYQCEKIQGDCDFEDSDWVSGCGWVQSGDDETDWQQASSTSLDHGPTHDHTPGSNGNYIYVEGKYMSPGSSAVVGTGVLYPASTNICYVRFWYYMHNQDPTAGVGSLRLVLEDAGGMRWTLVHRSGSYDPEWLQEVVLVSSTRPFHLLLEAETDDPQDTYIALDDFSTTPECVSGIAPPTSNTTCGLEEVECGTGECVPRDFLCDCFIDCVDGSDEAGCTVMCPSTATRTTTTANPTTTPTTTTLGPNDCLATQFPCGDAAFTCVASILRCDGVQDCPNHADEDGCPDTLCEDGFFYCGDPFMPQPPCIRNEFLCGSEVICNTYQPDESTCGTCPPSFCRNHGTCSAAQNQASTCSCHQQYEGDRCERYTGLTGGDITAIVFGSLAFLAFFSVLVYFVYKNEKKTGRTEDTDDSAAFPPTGSSHQRSESHHLDPLAQQHPSVRVEGASQDSAEA